MWLETVISWGGESEGVKAMRIEAWNTRSHNPEAV